MVTRASAAIGGGVQMPSYKIRNSIATKVLEKKVTKGYTICEETCVTCEMPLMKSSTGKTDCKVCPAITKWIERKNNEAKNTTAIVVKEEKVEEDDARDEVVKENRLVMRAERTMVEYDNDNEEEKEEVRDQAPRDPPADDFDYQAFMKRFGKMEVSQPSAALRVNPSVVSLQRSYASKEIVSVESDDTEVIRSRARQIIMNARRNHDKGWDGHRHHRATSYSYSAEDDVEEEVVEEEESYQHYEQQTSYEYEGSSYEPETTIESKSTEKSWDAMKMTASEIVAMAQRKTRLKEEEEYEDDSSEEEYPVPEAILTPPLSPRKSLSFNADKATPGLGSYEASIIIQSAIRGFLAKKMFNGMMFIKQYQHHSIDPPSGSSDQFETLGVATPTAGSSKASDEGDWNHALKVFNDSNFQNDCVLDTETEYLLEQVKQAKKKREVPSKSDIFRPKQVEQPQESRGLFSELACKFDDAVTSNVAKVKKVVTCTCISDGTAAPGLDGFADAYKAEQLALGRAKYESQLHQMFEHGWKDSGKPCHRCNKNYMMAPEGHLLCAGCDDLDLAVNEKEDEESEEFKEAVQDEEPEDVQEVNQEKSASIVDQEVNTDVDGHADTDQITHQLFNIERNRRLELGWIATEQSCPYCSAQLMRNPDDVTDQCLACGPIFTPQVAPNLMMAVPRYGPQGGSGANLGLLPPMPKPANHLQDTGPSKENEAMEEPMEDAVDDTKENAPEETSALKKLQQTNDRVAEAKKFILSKRTTPLTEQGQGQVFRPLGINSPMSHACASAYQRQGSIALATQNKNHATPVAPERVFFP